MVSLIHKLPTGGGGSPSRGPGRGGKAQGAGPTPYPGRRRRSGSRPQEPRAGSPPPKGALWVQEAPRPPRPGPAEACSAPRAPRLVAQCRDPGLEGLGRPGPLWDRPPSPGTPPRGPEQPWAPLSWRGGSEARAGPGWGWAGDIMTRCCQFLPDLGNPNIPLQELVCGRSFGRLPRERGGEAPGSLPPHPPPVPEAPSLRGSQGASASVRTSGQLPCPHPTPLNGKKNKQLSFPATGSSRPLRPSRGLTHPLAGPHAGPRLPAVPQARPPRSGPGGQGAHIPLQPPSLSRPVTAGLTSPGLVASSPEADAGRAARSDGRDHLGQLPLGPSRGHPVAGPPWPGKGGGQNGCNKGGRNGPGV